MEVLAEINFAPKRDKGLNVANTVAKGPVPQNPGNSLAS